MDMSAPLAYAGDPPAATDRAAALESAGLDTVRAAAAYGFDSSTITGHLAARSERMRIGSAVRNGCSRTPAPIARTAAGLDALTGGRAILGVGACGPQVVAGRPGRRDDRPPGRTREVIELSRRIWRREVIVHQGITDLPLPPGSGGRRTGRAAGAALPGRPRGLCPRPRRGLPRDGRGRLDIPPIGPDPARPIEHVRSWL